MSVQFELTTSERRLAKSLVEFVKREFQAMPVNSRFVFAIEMSRMMKPEIDELKRRAADTETARQQATEAG